MQLEKYPLPAEFMRNNKMCFLDPIRKILIQKTPEEIVRQKIVLFLQEELRVPKEMIELEVPMTHIKKGARGRADIIVFRKEGDESIPLILIECKNPNVELIDDVFEQAAKYNQIVLADTLVITNGIDMEWYQWDYTEELYLLLSKIPSYKELIEEAPLEYDKKEPYIWERPAFDLLKAEETYQHFLNNNWIGEATDTLNKEFIMNLSGCIQDTRVVIQPGTYQGIKVIKDGGIRTTRFGNSAGGSWIGDYRYVLVEDENNNTQLISFAVLGQINGKEGNISGNGYSCLIVAIDDLDKSHNSLQLNLDRHVKKDGRSIYKIWHDGRLTNGNKGRVKNSEVISYMKTYAPELIDENDQVNLGCFDNNRNIQLSDEAMKLFLGKIFKYALVRDAFRKHTKSDFLT